MKKVENIYVSTEIDIIISIPCIERIFHDSDTNGYEILVELQIDFLQGLFKMEEYDPIEYLFNLIESTINEDLKKRYLNDIEHQIFQIEATMTEFFMNEIWNEFEN